MSLRRGSKPRLVVGRNVTLTLTKNKYVNNLITSLSVTIYFFKVLFNIVISYALTKNFSAILLQKEIHFIMPAF
jgi:hypothetical protein